MKMIIDPNHFQPFPEQQLHPTHIDNNGYIITDQLPPQPPPIHYQDPYNNHNHNHHFQQQQQQQQQQQHHHNNTNNDSNFDPSLLHIQANGHNQFQHQPLSSHSPSG